MTCKWLSYRISFGDAICVATPLFTITFTLGNITSNANNPISFCKVSFSSALSHFSFFYFTTLVIMWVLVEGFSPVLLLLNVQSWWLMWNERTIDWLDEASAVNTLSTVRACMSHLEYITGLLHPDRLRNHLHNMSFISHNGSRTTWIEIKLTVCTAFSHYV